MFPRKKEGRVRRDFVRGPYDGAWRKLDERQEIQAFDTSIHGNKLIAVYRMDKDTGDFIYVRTDKRN